MLGWKNFLPLPETCKHCVIKKLGFETEAKSRPLLVTSQNVKYYCFAVKVCKEEREKWALVPRKKARRLCCNVRMWLFRMQRLYVLVTQGLAYPVLKYGYCVTVFCVFPFAFPLRSECLEVPAFPPLEMKALCLLCHIL